jgi:predicted membrane protein
MNSLPFVIILLLASFVFVFFRRGVILFYAINCVAASLFLIDWLYPNLLFLLPSAGILVASYWFYSTLLKNRKEKRLKSQEMENVEVEEKS